MQLKDASGLAQARHKHFIELLLHLKAAVLAQTWLDFRQCMSLDEANLVHTLTDLGAD